tara:strand:- start:125 stop:304 length:180 start_codon:yes stop_codon:yes gene_type:complete
MPIVKFPYTKEGEKNAKAAAKEYGGKYIADKSENKGMSVMIAVGSAKKSPAKRRRRKKA